MKKFATVFLTVLMGAIVVKGQSTLFNRIDSLDRRPLVIINGKIVDPLSFLALDIQDVQDLKAYTSEEAMKEFGDARGRFGAIQVTLVKNAKILTWTELAKQFYFIPGKMPVKAKILYGYFGGLEFNDVRLFISSASMVTSMGLMLKDSETGKPMVSVGIYKNDNKYKPKQGNLENHINTIKQRFDRESIKRQEIQAAKTVIRG
jgi:hypothetical protein